MAKAAPGAKWYEDQRARNRQKRAEAAALRPPRPPGIRTDPERWRAYNREWMRARYVPHPRPPGAPRRPEIVVPIPSCPSGHPLYDEARRALRGIEVHELGGDMDSGAQDLLQDFVAASLCGEDPLVAVAASRRRSDRDRKVLVYGLDRVDDLRR
jgi:hypothetical protein